MKKIDARSLSPEAQEERRYQALRLRGELAINVEGDCAGSGDTYWHGDRA